MHLNAGSDHKLLLLPHPVINQGQLQTIFCH